MKFKPIKNYSPHPFQVFDLGSQGISVNLGFVYNFSEPDIDQFAAGEHYNPIVGWQSQIPITENNESIIDLFPSSSLKNPNRSTVISAGLAGDLYVYANDPGYEEDNPNNYISGTYPSANPLLLSGQVKLTTTEPAGEGNFWYKKIASWKPNGRGGREITQHLRNDIYAFTEINTTGNNESFSTGISFIPDYDTPLWTILFQKCQYSGTDPIQFVQDVSLEPNWRGVSRSGESEFSQIQINAEIKTLIIGSEGQLSTRG